MKILDKIVEDKKIELKDLSSKIPVTLLEKRSLFSRQCISLKNSILNSPNGIICEFKRKSPSNNNINYLVFKTREIIQNILKRKDDRLL